MTAIRDNHIYQLRVALKDPMFPIGHSVLDHGNNVYLLLPAGTTLAQCLNYNWPVVTIIKHKHLFYEGAMIDMYRGGASIQLWDNANKSLNLLETEHAVAGFG